MAPFQAVIDTQALIYLTKVGQHEKVWELLPNLFSRLLVPQEVVNEFNRGLNKYPEGYPVADAIDRGGFLEKCTTYDTGTLQIMQAEPKVHPGEAEAAAQQLHISSDFIWSDDKPFTASVRRLLPSVRIFNTLHIVALFDLQSYFVDYLAFVKQLHVARPINSGNFTHCYREAARYLGFSMTQSELKAKTDLKKMGVI